MALKATIFKADIQIADMDRAHYADYSLTLARHPSETDERMMVRLLAFALFAHPALVFARGLSVDDEPGLWQLDLTGRIERWIDVGQPDEKWLRKACGRADEVVVLSYGRGLDVWWNGVREKLARQSSLRVIEIAREASADLARLAERSMRLQFSIQDGGVWVTNGRDNVQIEPRWLQGGERS
ncbi:hypothetical protein M622_09640 [Thauera terpenica 58Eu]|jgi:uncharacterized protein YaeQ|uniref:YaeQ family protein n=1 Tax=Thauera terpenica 58Eu TaxID=1348657 RepID=S9ZTX3_9RHOO|nr:YaeQ family protein [Thauera terpenica]EPZ16987.1 hypothetical protein M622_09640 [Thauera terpenica 58Eu]MBP6726870.1 YaeQ family protein [Thauera sp.]MBP6761830.1 YaeQ family protein [Thauera sp.]